ncbi:porin [Sedimentitalea sp. JM2-8]|uniref:Porin n=1 Tax=Sedimentitalea xiamensis TaxID=3050037 RepID=A0ABT7F907_9RHOB|nr:porin [Sedimentitalea xiamensis]MDK3071581.1 porin [Sedimentitalea xiamensis]
MKKVLFATTALIALGSMAAADVRLSGYGRFGLDYNDLNSTDANDDNYNGVSDMTITSRLRLQVDMSAETDGGVGFNARVRMQAESRDNAPQSNGGVVVLRDATGAIITRPDGVGNDVPVVTRPNDNGFNGARFGVTYGGLIVNVGNIIGAVENAPGLYTTGTRSAGTGIDGMGFNSLVLKNVGWDAYDSDGQGVNGVEALYTVGGFTGHISYSEDNDDVASFDDVNGISVPGETRLGLMATYSFGDYYVTGAYQDSSDGIVIGGDDLNDLYFLAAGGDFGQFGAKIAYGESTLTKAWSLEGNMDIGAASNILVWVTDASSNKTIDIGGTPTDLGSDGTSWGINYQYDLGGGATFVAGYVDSENKLAAAHRQDQKQFQAGVYFSF